MFIKFYRTVQDLRTLVFPEQSSIKSTELSGVELSGIFTEISTFYHEKFCKFSLTSIPKYLHPQFGQI